MMGGGVHLAALSIMFPTPIERLLWEIACYSLLGISGCIGICSILVFLVFILDRGYPSRLLENLPRLLLRQGAGSRSSRHRSQHRISTSRKRWMDITASVVGGFLAVVVVFLMFAVPILFFGSRIYIVLESFVSLRRVPMGVYQTPRLNIMGNFPHL